MTRSDGPFRILHIDTESGWRGGEQQVYNLIKGLGNFKVEQYAAGVKDKEFLGRISGMVKETLPLPRCGELSLSAFLKIARFSKKNRIDIIHSHTAKAHGQALGSLLFNGTPVIAAHRRVDFRIPDNVLKRFKYNFSKTGAVIAISKAIKNILESSGVNKEKLRLIYSSVDPDRFWQPSEKAASEIRNEFEIPDNVPVIGNTAAFAPHKDHATLLKAASMLHEAGVDFRLLLPGDGKLLGDTKKLCRSLGISGKVLFPGFRKDLKGFFSLFDIFVNSSSEEGLGTSVIDALAAGLPVAATSAGGVPEILDGGKYGLLSPPKDPHGLYLSLNTLIEDPGKRDAFSARARQRALFFNIDSMAEKTFSVYKEILNV
ncbi:MAG: glycosyltransferase [Fibrobacterota bacterium]